MIWDGEKQGRRHELEDEGGGVNTVKTLKFDKIGGA